MLELYFFGNWFCCCSFLRCWCFCCRDDELHTSTVDVEASTVDCECIDTESSDVIMFIRLMSSRAFPRVEWSDEEPRDSYLGVLGLNPAPPPFNM